MFESQVNEPVARPTMCPFCKFRAIDTLAKVITATTFWRCRGCERTWTIASLRPSSSQSSQRRDRF
jgi:ribosomal protein L37AE/L43A